MRPEQSVSNRVQPYFGGHIFPVGCKPVSNRQLVYIHPNGVSLGDLPHKASDIAY